MSEGKGPRFLRGPRLLHLVALATALLALPFSGPALAHAERISSQPEENTRVQQPPTQLSIGFTEPPTGDAVLEVLDGCGDDVVDTLEVQNMEILAGLVQGSPGRWRVTSTVVSGVDGHQTRDSWSFRVAGPQDCSQASGGRNQGGDRPEDDDDPFPLIPVLLGVAAVLGVAVLLRVLTGRTED